MSIRLGRLTQVVRQLFSERVSGFRLGNKSFRYLVDTYLSQHVSIQQLLRTLQVRRPPPLSDRAQVHLMPAIVAHVAQYALMDHYFANPLSVLTEPFGRRQSAAARAAILEQLTPLHAQALRLLPSLQRYACWLRNRRRGRAPLTAPFLCSPQLLRGARRVGPGGRQAPPVRRRLPAAAGGSPVPGPPGRPRAPRHRRPVRSAPPRPSPTVPALH